MVSSVQLEDFFASYSNDIIGYRQCFESPFGSKEIVYADWTASGRAYRPIETCMQNEILPFVGNTHTGTTITGTLMSAAYEAAKSVVKKHVRANEQDALVFCGSGMTAAVSKLQRILGLRTPDRLTHYTKNGRESISIDETLRPMVFVTQMEHHSNQISWMETIAKVAIIPNDDSGNVDMEYFRAELERYRHVKNKIAAITACSNVTGIQTPYHRIARLLHTYGGICCVDFACSAPYVNIDMHPAEEGTHLDAIYFSPHKFLGGPGTPGVLVFNENLYANAVPDQPGGGTMAYSNPWAGRAYISGIEQREDGGTPPFLQAIRAAMCVQLKEEMGVDNILRREEEMVQLIFSRMSRMKTVQVLEGHISKRLGVISFIVPGVHYNLIVKMLNDRFGIQTRGGCSCAGTYGHHLLQIDAAESLEIFKAIQAGDLSCKPGWIRLSIHPTMTNAEIEFIMDAIELTATHVSRWRKDYTYHPASNEFTFNGFEEKVPHTIGAWLNGYRESPLAETEDTSSHLSKPFR